MNAETVTLTTFFESDPEYAAVPERYLAGFRDLSGKSWGVIVPLDAEEVRRVVASEERTWTVAMYDIEGLVHPQPEDVDDEYFAMLEAGNLERVAIDELIEDAIDSERNEPDEETLPDLKKLKERLQHCMTMVNTEIARRERRLG
jgi:hypothetical protein